MPARYLAWMLSLQAQLVAGDAADAGALQRIRAALSQQPAINTIAPQPTFTVDVQAQSIGLFEKPDLSAGPRIPGGLYQFELRQMLGNPWSGEPWIKIDVLPIAERVIKSMKDARHTHDERTAHEEVLRALSPLCSMNVCAATEREGIDR